MPIKLNPCAKCGESNTEIDLDENGYFLVECNSCGNSECGVSKSTAREAWNAANPKEASQMSDERKPVICPWCGFEMAAYTISIQGYSGEKKCFYECAQCCARSPMAVTNRDAYNAATRRPPNRPLTLQEAHDYGVRHPNDPLWIEHDDGSYEEASTMLLIPPGSMAGAAYGITWTCWLRKPSPADIEAARKERDA